MVHGFYYFAIVGNEELIHPDHASQKTILQPLLILQISIKRSDFLKHLAIKNCKKMIVKNV